jgi:hypothetical protein
MCCVCSPLFQVQLLQLGKLLRTDVLKIFFDCQATTCDTVCSRGDEDEVVRDHHVKEKPRLLCAARAYKTASSSRRVLDIYIRPSLRRDSSSPLLWRGIVKKSAHPSGRPAADSGPWRHRPVLIAVSPVRYDFPNKEHVARTRAFLVEGLRVGLASLGPYASAGSVVKVS